MADLSKALGIKFCVKRSLTTSKLKLYYTRRLSKVRMVVAKRDGEESVVVKGSVPRALKLQFKVLCIQKEVEISAVLEDLLGKWIQANAPVPESPANLSDEDSEVVKGYVPKSLKLQFKVLCTQKRVKMGSVLCNLITEWVQAGSSTETRR